MHMQFLFNLLPLLALAPQSSYASVLAIDYGTDWIKASLMKPGVPFDVLLNKDSKRKIQSSVAWKKDDRLFGGDAFNLASRFPKDSFSSIKHLMAAPFESPATSFFTTVSSSELVETSRKTVALKRSDKTEWSVEELVGMQFAYVKQLAETLAGEAVSEVIVTVPPFYTQFERDAVADAIEIAGLRTLALINDGTAVAVNYAMTRTFPEPEHHIIYDAGAGSTRATVVTFSTTKDTKKVPGGTKINVAGVGYDRTTGGAELDRRLRDILVDAFITKHHKDVRTDDRAMAKLWKETGRIKAILSANVEAVATIESLAFDIDFRAKVTRAQFEEACSDLTSHFTQPIKDALAAADLPLANITSVILTGGSTRTPMIQAAVRSFVGDDKIALNVNADEAAVLGAAFHGASLSRQFKTKNIKVTDIGLHNIQVSYHASAATGSSAAPRMIKTLLFPSGSKTGNKKTLTFKRKEDFSLFLDYETEVAPGFPKQILETEITGVSDALANLTENGAVDPVIKATISLSESGFISVLNAVAFGEIKDESIAGKLKGLFGSGSSSTEEPSSENTPIRESTTASAASPSSSADAKDKEKAKPLDTIALNITNKFTSIPPMSAADKRASRSRLRAIDSDEAAKNRKEEARNTLESYLYRMRDFLDEENKETPFKKCSQETERKVIADKLEELFDWLSEKGDVAETSQLLDKRNSLEALERPIVHRYKEIETFPTALNNSQMWNWSTRLFLQEARTNLTAEIAADLPSKWTADELDGLEKTLKEHEVWLNEWVEKQKSVKMNEDPVIETTEMKARAKVLETHLQRLFKRKVPKTKKKTATTSSAEPTPTDEETPEAAPTSPVEDAGQNETALGEEEIPVSQDGGPRDEL